MKEAPVEASMKRDMRLIREMLCLLEAAPPQGLTFDEEEAGKLRRSLDDVRYNIQQAEKMGLIEVLSKPLSQGEWMIGGLTPKGYDFLEHNSEQATSTTVPAVEPVASTANPSESNAQIPEKRAELLTLKPTVWGVGIDLKEAARRVRRWFDKP
jgi:Hypothetical protein (DUF2513)